MRLLNRALAVLGTVVVIAVIAALVTPKAVHALVSTFVTVVNTPAQPVPTLATDAHTAFHASGSCLFNGSQFCTVGAGIPPIFRISQGQIAVLESTSGRCTNSVGNITSIDIEADIPPLVNPIQLEYTHGNAGGGAVWTWTYRLKAYQPGAAALFIVVDSDANQTGATDGCYYEIDGYLVSQ